MARYDVTRLGRFSSPDPLAGDISNPQSLNHYPYSGNDTLNWIDPSGMNRAMIGGNSPGSTFDPGGGLGVGGNGSVWGGAFPVFGSLSDGDSWGIIGYVGFGSVGQPLGGGGGTLQKIKDTINSALNQANLAKCLNKFFGSGTILTNHNLPSIDAT